MMDKECEHEIFSDKKGDAKCRKCGKLLLYIYNFQQTELMVAESRIKELEKIKLWNTSSKKEWIAEIRKTEIEQSKLITDMKYGIQKAIEMTDYNIEYDLEEIGVHLQNLLKKDNHE